MSNGLQTNFADVFDAFCQLNNKEMNKAIKRCIVKGAKELQKEAQSNLSSSIQQSGRSRDKFNDKLQDGILLMKVGGDYGDELSGGVHIMGNNKKGSGTYRLRFLEKGTQDRYAKTFKGKQLEKPRFLGHVNGTGFFKQARESVISRIESIYAAEIDKTIQKINQTKL